jgi:hypothetical protein
MTAQNLSSSEAPAGGPRRARPTKCNLTAHSWIYTKLVIPIECVLTSIMVDARSAVMIYNRDADAGC